MEHQTVTLSLQAVISDALYMRAPLGSADAPDGTRYDVAVSVSGGEIIVGVYPPTTGEPRRQYIITCEAVVNAIRKLESAQPSLKLTTEDSP